MVSALKADLDTNTEQSGAFLAVDFKLVNLGSHLHQEQFVALVVVCCPAGQRLAIFDLAHSEAILTGSGLAELLTSENIQKVVHDVRRVSPLLAQRFALRLNNVFDTQVGNN